MNLYKRKLKVIAWLTLISFLSFQRAYALPTGQEIISGEVTFEQINETTLNITASENAIINYSSFDIGAGETVNFFLPTLDAFALNRITGGGATNILGALNANGNLVLVNNNGFFFGPSANVTVGGLIASTHNISDANFLAGNYVFAGADNALEASSSSILNSGSILTREGGMAILIADAIENRGTIEAPVGMVAFAAGNKVSVGLSENGMISVVVDEATARQIFDKDGHPITEQIKNLGTISSASGKILITAKTVEQIFDSIMDIQGVVRADKLVEHGDGSIELVSSMNIDVSGDLSAEGGSIKIHAGDTALVSGTLNVSDAQGEGGVIQVLGQNVGILTGAHLEANGATGGGQILIGGAYKGEGEIPTASATIVQSNAYIEASSLESGDGGEVIVWSDDYTNFSGHIEAKALGETGNGGFVETSGKTILQATGNVDASSANGQAGQWLLDPADVTISTGADSNNTGNPNFVPNETASVINTTTIETALNAGTSVTVTTGGDAFTGNGDITVSNTISKTAGGDATLTLSAFRNITVSAAISSDTGKLNVVLGADNANNNSGYINIAAAITSNNGNITLSGGSNLTTGYATGNAGQAAGISVTAAVDAGEGSLTVRGRGASGVGSAHGVFTNGATAALKNSGSAALTIHGVGQGSSGYGLRIAGSSTISTVDGLLTINGQGSTSGTGTVRGVYILGGGVVKTTGSGNIDLTGISGGTGATNVGVQVEGFNSLTTTGTGNITVVATGSQSATTTGNYGFRVVDGSVVTASGNINITGTSGTGTNTNIGIYINAGRIVAGGSGNITLDATAKGSGVNDGLWLLPAGTFSSENSNAAVIAHNGNINITGRATQAATSSNSWGVNVDGSYAGTRIQTTGQGNITVDGYGGLGTSGGVGVLVNVANGITATGTGSITVTGTGNTAATATTGNVGVRIIGSITGQNGNNINITGIGGTGTGGSDNTGNHGIRITTTNSAITTSGNGTITLNGTAKGNNASNYGVYIGSTTISTEHGNLTITGQGSTTGTNSNYGINITGTGTVKTTGTGNIIANGTGGGNGSSNYGIRIAATNTFNTTASGNITLNGQASSAGTSNNFDIGMGGTVVGANLVTFNNAVTLTADSSVTGGTISFGSNAVDGAFALSLTAGSGSGTITSDSVGSTTALASLTSSGNWTFTKTMNVTGALTVNGGTLNATSAAAVTVGSVVLGGGIFIPKGGSVGGNNNNPLPPPGPQNLPAIISIIDRAIPNFNAPGGNFSFSGPTMRTGNTNNAGSAPASNNFSGPAQFVPAGNVPAMSGGFTLENFGGTAGDLLNVQGISQAGGFKQGADGGMELVAA